MGLLILISRNVKLNILEVIQRLVFASCHRVSAFFFVSHYAMSRSKESWLPNPSKLLFCWVLCNAICMQPNRFWSCESSLLCWRHLEMLQRLGVSCDALARIHLGGKWPTVSPVQRGLQLRPRRRSGRKISYNSTISWWTKVIKKLETKTIIMATMTKMTPRQALQRKLRCMVSFTKSFINWEFSEKCKCIAWDLLCLVGHVIWRK